LNKKREYGKKKAVRREETNSHQNRVSLTIRISKRGGCERGGKILRADRGRSRIETTHLVPQMWV